MLVELFVYNARSDEINKMSYAEPHSNIEYFPRGLFDPLNPIFDNVFISGTINKVNMCRFDWQGLTYVCSCQCFYITASNLYRIEGHIDPAATMYNIDGFKYCHFWFDRTPKALSINARLEPGGYYTGVIKRERHIPATTTTDVWYAVHMNAPIPGLVGANRLTGGQSPTYITDAAGLDWIHDTVYGEILSSNELKWYANSISHITTLRGVSATTLYRGCASVSSFTLSAVIDPALIGTDYKFISKNISVPSGIMMLLYGRNTAYNDYVYNLDTDITLCDYGSTVTVNYGNIITQSYTLNSLGLLKLQYGETVSLSEFGFRLTWDFGVDLLYMQPIVDAQLLDNNVVCAELTEKTPFVSSSLDNGLKLSDIASSITGAVTPFVKTIATPTIENAVGAFSAPLASIDKIINGAGTGSTTTPSGTSANAVLNNQITVDIYRQLYYSDNDIAEYCTGYVSGYYSLGQPSYNGVYRCQRFEFSGREITKGYPSAFIDELKTQLQSYYYLSSPSARTISE